MRKLKTISILVALAVIMFTSFQAARKVNAAIKPPTRGMECLVSQPTLKGGSTGECAIFLQTVLNTMSLPVDIMTIDGQFGRKTEAGVKAYQAANKDSDGNQLVVDGIVGPKTWSSIKQQLQPAAAAPLADIKPDDGPGGINRFASKIDPSCIREYRQNDRGECVKKVQTLLGFTGADVDGIFGPLTKQLVVNFQKGNTDLYGNWLTANGVVTYATLAKLLSGQFNPVSSAVTTSLSMSSGNKALDLLNSPTAKRYRAMQNANSARNQRLAHSSSQKKSKSKKSKTCRGRRCHSTGRGGGGGNNKGSGSYVTNSQGRVSTGYRGGDMGSSFHGGGTYSSYQSYYQHNGVVNKNAQITGGF